MKKVLLALISAIVMLTSPSAMAQQCPGDNLAPTPGDDAGNSALASTTYTAANPLEIQLNANQIAAIVADSGQYVSATGAGAKMYIPGAFHSSGDTVIFTTATDTYVDASGNTVQCTASGYPKITASQTTFTCDDLGAGQITLTYTDAANNTTQDVINIVVVDPSSPNVVAQSATFYLDSDGALTVSDAEAVAFDGGTTSSYQGVSGYCPSSFTYSISPNSFDCDDLGQSTVTLTVTNPTNNNDGSASATITVLDTISPTIAITNSSYVVQLDADGDGALLFADVATSDDNCSVTSTQVSPSIFDCDDAGTSVLVTLTATDASGNETTSTVTVDIEDSVDPVFTQDANVTLDLDANGSVDLDTDDSWYSIDEACSYTVTFSPSVLDCDDIAQGGSVTYTVTDASGNQASGTVTVPVADNISPTVITQDITVALDASGSATIESSDIDNGSSDNCNIDSYALDITSFDCDDIGSNTVTLTVEDVNGNSSSATATVTIEDNLAPNTIALSQQYVLYTNQLLSGEISVTATVLNPTSSDNCGIVDTVLTDVDSNLFYTGTQLINTFTCDDVSYGTIDKSRNIVIHNIDASGNWSKDTANVILVDVDAPSITVTNASVSLDANGSVNLLTDNYVSASDECGVDSVWLSQTEFDCSDLGTQTITAFARDIHGNENTETLEVTIADDIAPTITLASSSIDVYLDASGAASLPAVSSLATATDNCTDPQSVTVDINSFDCDDVGANTVTFTAEDDETNASTATITVNVIDTISPVISANTSHTLVLDGNGAASLSVNDDVENGSTDACGIASSVLSQTDFDCDDLGSNTITYTVTDNNGNSSVESITVDVQDNSDPTATAQDLTVELDANGSASITTAQVDDGSSDNCSIVSYSLDVSDFDCSNLGDNTVTLTVEDAAGNSASATATITVEDNRAPNLDLIATGDTIKLNPNGERVVTVPGIIGDVDDNCTAEGSITITVEYENVCDNSTASGTSVTLDCDDVSTLACAQSATNPNGLRTFVVTAEDESGNTTTEEISLYVVDLVAPNVYPKNVTLYLPEDANGDASVVVDANAYTGTEAGDANDPVGLDSATNDACGIQSVGLLQSATQADADETLTYDCEDLGDNTYFLRATDENDNRAATAAIITIVDTIKPELTTQVATIYVDASGNATLDPNDLVDEASDNIDVCGLTYSASRVDFDCDDLNFDATISDPVSADAQDVNNWSTVTVDVTVEDIAGNDRVRAAEVRVIDNVPPTLVRTSITVDLNAQNFVSLQNVQDTIIDFVSDDNCALDPTRGGMSQTYFDCSDVGSNQVTLTMFDAYGNSSNVTLEVIVRDNVAPTAIAQDIAVSLDAAGLATIQPSDIDNGSSDNCEINSYALDITSFDCSSVGNNTVTLTVTDVHGNSSTATATVTVVDDINPDLAGVSTAVTIALDANGSATLTIADFDQDVVEACDFTSTFSQSVFDCDDVSTSPNEVTYTVEDASGNSSSMTVDVTVEDNIAPTAVALSTYDIYLDANGSATLSFSDLDNGSSDNCSFVGSLDITDFDCDDVNVAVTVTGTLTDPSGNTASFTTDVTARDTLGPVFASSQGDTTLYAVQYDCFAMFGTGDDPSFEADDQNCPGAISYFYQWIDENGNANTISAGSPIPVGEWTVNTVASDPLGNQTLAPFTVTVLDTTLPTMQFLNSPVIALGSNGQTTITPAMIENSSYDNCGIETVAISPAVVDCDDLGSVSLSVTVTDWNGNSNTYNGITASVVDEDAPSITVVSTPVDVVLDANGSASVDVSALASAVDNCTATPVMSVSPSSVDCSDLGSVTVTITATDASGNTSIATKAINVVDNTSPVIAVSDITLNLTSNGVVTIPVGTATASDNCSSSPSVEYSASTFTCSDVGVNTVTVSTMDASGNSASTTFNVTVVDAVAPTITTVGTAPSVLLDNMGMASISSNDVVASYSDNCDVASVSVSPSSFDCSHIGTVSVVITVEDVNGNVSTATQDVVVSDQVAPVITTVSTPVTLYLDATGSASVTSSALASATDNCTSSPTLTLSESTFSCSEVGSNTVTVTATDASGNSSTATKAVVVMDTISPAITSPATLTLSLGSGGSVTLPGSTASASDNCGSPTIVYSETSFNCSNIGTNNVTVTATDANGNSSTSTIVVTVQDVTNPTLALVPTAVTLGLDANGSASLSTAQVVSSVSDNCSGVTVTVTPSSFGCTDLGSNTVTVTATDASGNTTTATKSVTVVDQVAPVITTVSTPVTLYLDATGSASVTSSALASATDNCTSSPTLTLSESTFSCSEVGSNTVTVTATDASGNSSTATKAVVVMDTISPAITSPATLTLSLGSGGSVTLPGSTASASDNCGSPTIVYSETSFNCSNIGTNNVTVTATDANGNSSTSTIVVTVQDVTNPTLALVPTAVTLGLDANGSASLSTAQVVSSVSDNCSGVTVTVTPSSFGCTDLGSNTVTVTATDASGNTTTATKSVTVVDLIDPVISTVTNPSDVILDVNGSATITSAMVVSGVTDNCTSAPTVTITPTSVDCSDLGVVTVTVIAQDANGNTSTTTVPLNVVDQDAPVIVSAPADTTLPQCNAQFNYAVNVTDNCGFTATMTSGLASGSTFPVGTTTVTWVFADASGNSVTHSFDVTVDPLGTYTLPVKDEFCYDNGPFDLQDGQTGLVFSGAGVSATGDIFQPAVAGIGTHTLNFTFTDANGCEQIGTWTVTVNPTPQQPSVLQMTPTTLRSSEAGASYKWYRNGNRLVGETNQDLFISQGGNYQVEVYNAFGCYRRSTGFVISSTGLSVEELLKDVSIYPNPTSSQVSIVFNWALESDVRVELVDMLGRTLYNSSINAGDVSHTIDMSSMTAGTYQLIIRDNETGNSTIERIIKVD